MSFDYAYTCPDIDRNIEDFRKDLRNEIERFFIRGSVEIPEELEESIYDEIESIADGLFDEIAELREELSEAKGEIEDLHIDLDKAIEEKEKHYKL